MMRLKPRSTLLPGSQIARCISTNAATSRGLRCMVRTLFGTNPNVWTKESNCSFSSGACSGGNGSSRGDVLAVGFIGRAPPGSGRRTAAAPPSTHVLQQQQQAADDADIGQHAVLHAGPHRALDLPEPQQESGGHD